MKYLEGFLAALHMLIAVTQFILHYLAWFGIIVGVIPLLFGNWRRGVEMIVGGICLIILKYVIGFVYLFSIGILGLASNGPTNKQEEVNS